MLEIFTEEFTKWNDMSWIVLKYCSKRKKKSSGG